ncbi:hypothetical protein SLEP1_g58567 [Rubroshorea leprosula]|uniref:Uncharacterized protein n=1 Tax=Rubroshorea leprosula TaxID=152421 RepID=A0AAV5MSH6_9ROSI|nr:hypothetical protein SLEP1_g58567 [Rubroshorea leprosula]
MMNSSKLLNDPETERIFMGATLWNLRGRKRKRLLRSVGSLWQNTGNFWNPMILLR